VLPPWIPTLRNIRFKRARAELNRQVYRIIDKRKNENIPYNDLLKMLMEAGKANSGMSDGQLRDEVMTLLLAGHETTENLLSWACCLISQHPSVCNKLKDELKEVLDGRDPGVGDLPSLKYTKAILQESLRLYPPVWIIRRNTINQDLIGGYPIPPGTTVTLCSYTLHRHPDFWSEPEKFNPERFLPGKNAGPAVSAYFPFGGGPCSCVGSHFAMMEAQIILGMIFRRYSMELEPGHPVEPEPLVTLRPRHGLRMILKQIENQGP